MLTFEEAVDLFSYDEQTGNLIRRATRGNQPAGSIAGHTTIEGYVVISINGRTYKAHRIVWLIKTGIWPNMDIDHEDTDKANNRWANLRLADDSTNGANRPVRRDNKLGVKGITLQRRAKRYLARLTVRGHTRVIGWID